MKNLLGLKTIKFYGVKLLQKKYSLTAVLMVFTGVIFVSNSDVFINNLIRKDHVQLTTPALLEKYANQIIAECSKERFTPPCYDREIPKLMDFLSMEDTFKVIWLVQKKDDRLVYCHVLGHKLSYIETARNPAAWKDILTRCPTTKCNNGCLHGSLMKRFNDEYLTSSKIEELIPDLMDVCEPRGSWRPHGVEIAMCYHAIGHLNMYITRADISKSLAICKKIGEKEDGRSYTQTCTEGVYMQIFQPLEPEDYALVKGLTPEQEKIPPFCVQNSSEPYQYQACRRESWPLFRDEQETPWGLMKFCSFANTEEFLRVCEATVLSHITTDLILARKNTEGMVRYCLGLPPKRDSQCFGEVAMRLIQLDPILADKAVAICNMAEERSMGEECFKKLLFYSTFSFRRGTSEFFDYCHRLPESWARKCIQREPSPQKRI